MSGRCQVDARPMPGFCFFSDCSCDVDSFPVVGGLLLTPLLNQETGRSENTTLDATWGLDAGFCSMA